VNISARLQRKFEYLKTHKAMQKLSAREQRRKLGVSKTTITKWRKELGIQGNSACMTQEQIDALHADPSFGLRTKQATETDPVIAERHNIAISTVMRRRHLEGIAPAKYKPCGTSKYDFGPLCRDPDIVYEDMGVLSKRHGIPRQRVSRKKVDMGITTIEKVPQWSWYLIADNLYAWKRPEGIDSHLEYLREHAS